MVAPESTRAEAVQKALEAEEAKKDAERRFLPWKDGREKCVVVEIELGLVILNPRSHRIQAQIDGHPNAELVRDDPQSAEAQKVIGDLLRATEGYEDIKASLEAEGQREPGVVTRKGVLVNGNTRAVALRDLGQEYIRLLVLPLNATQQQISELELRLQVSKEFKQDYTFTNQLLFVRECLTEAHWTYERVAREVGYAARLGKKRGIERVRQDERVLDLIEEMRQHSGRRYAYTFFDKDQTALVEIDRDYESLKDVDPAAARDLRTSRLVGVLSGLGYRELRHVQPGFLDDYLLPEIEEDDDLSVFTPELLGDDYGASDSEGLEILGDANESSASERVLSWLMNTKGSATVSVNVGGKKFSRPRDEVVEDLRVAMEAAATASRDDRRREDLVDQPGKRLREARDKVKRATEAFRKARKDARFDDSRFSKVKYSINKLVKEVGDLAGAIQKEEAKRR